MTIIKYLKENNIGRATFYPLDVIKPRYIDDNTMKVITNYNGYIDIASNLVKYDDIYTNVMLNLLGNVIIVDTIDTANVLSKQIQNKYRIISLDGQVVNVGGSITGGKNIKESNIISLKYELDKYKSDIKNYIDRINILDKQIKDIDNNINTLGYEKYNIKSKINELIEINNNKKNILNTHLSDKERLDKELKDLSNITSSKSELEQLLNKYYSKKEELDNKQKQLDIYIIDKDKLEQNIKEIEQDFNSSNNIINKKEKELNNLNILVNRMDVKLDNLLNNLTNDYNITYSYAKENYKLEIDVELAKKKVSSLKNTLNELGIVNLGSIDEYERINERYEFLTKQKEDLSNADITLNEIINQMDNIMKSKFIETFNEIQKEFKTVFKSLFKGGNAELLLTNPDDLLETGIEIKAEPPGKKLQSITLLSGGEKTFTAISLLFAILNVRSVPFCIFDEVEAALDDANVENFGNYLSTYRDKTQFILITHKKKTMEFADVLYGVTMQESGVSKMVSVRLEDNISS